MADEPQDAPAQDSPSAVQFPPSIPQDGQLSPPLQKVGEAFSTDIGRDWSQDVLARIQQHDNMAQAVNANTAAGDQFMTAMKTVKDNLIDMVGGDRGDPHAWPLALDLAPKLIGPLLETTGLPADQMQAAHDQITSEVSQGIAHAAVMKAADYHAPMAFGLMDQLKDYIHPDDQASLGQYINTLHVARTLDNQAIQEQAAQNQAQASQVAAFKFGSTLLDPRTENVSYPQGFLQSLVRNQSIAPEDKQGLFTAASRLQTQGDVHASDPHAVAQVLNDIINPRAAVAHDDIMQHVGDDLRYVDALTLHGMNLQRTPEGQANVKQLADAIDMGRRTLAPSNDLAGNVAYSRFVNWLLPAYRRTGVGGLNPDSDNYLFKNTSIANFAPTARDAVPPFSPKRQSLGDIFGGNRG